MATEQYGIVVFTEISGELVDASELAAFYPHLIEANVDHVWGRWRPATLAELIRTWPARPTAGLTERQLRIARQKARSLVRRRARLVSSF
ncbi:MAG: hypothetical protein E5W69_00675 [Mesorhizobium sp.]|nr:MAG: hypothetical protein E5W69_00675 [Mesorhizobium sp.]